VWKDFVGRLNDWGIRDLVDLNKSEMSISFPDFNNSIILFKGLDDPEKLKSLNITGLWIEECTDVSEDSFRQLNARLRVPNLYYQTILTFNPDDEQHWIRQRFFGPDGIETLDPVTTNCVHTSYIDNRFIDIPEYEKTLLEMGKGNPIWLTRFQEGFWARKISGSEFYHSYDDEKHSDRDISYNPNKPLHISFDFNVVPYMTMTIYQIEQKNVLTGRKRVVQVDEICLEPPRALTEAVCQVFKMKYNKHQAGLYVYGDGTSRKKNTMSDKDDFDIIMRELSDYNPILKLRQNVSVHIRGQWINKILAGGENFDISIHPVYCKHSRQDLLYVKLDEDGNKMKQYIKDAYTGQRYQQYGHTSDAMDYFLTTAFRSDFEYFQLGKRIKPHLIKEYKNETIF
jgi:hypothetical protein